MSWWSLIAVGVVWLVVVVGTLVVSLASAELLGATDIAEDPSSFRVVVAAASGAIFGLPGVIMIVAGLRRRKSRRRDPPGVEG